MHLYHYLLYLLRIAYAYQDVITISDTSCVVEFGANFRLLATQTFTASVVTDAPISELEELLPEFVGYLAYNGSIICTPTADPSITLPTSVMPGLNGAEVPSIEYPWSWSCMPDSCATVTSLGSQSQLVVNYGSGGPHWSFTALSTAINNGVYTYTYSSGCTTTTNLMTLYLPDASTLDTVASSTTRDTVTTIMATATTASAMITSTTTMPLLPSTGIVIAGYTVCPRNEDSCGQQWEIYPISNVLQTTTSYSYPGCASESALMTSVASTPLVASAIPTIGGFDVDGKSDCTYNGGPVPGLSCVTASTLQCTICPQPYALINSVGVCGGILVDCGWNIDDDASPMYGTEAYCIW